MVILSLCDGISCGRIALEKAGIAINKYYASEINKDSIAITMKNYPDTIQLGDMRNLNVDALKKLPKIDGLIAGTPCQNLSITVVDREELSKGLQGDKSSLFYQFYYIFKWLKKNNNPNIWFLLENVESMREEDKNIITTMLDVEPLMLDSALVSAQDRKRYYWTNIKAEGAPKDKGIILKDIMEDDVSEKYYYKKDFEFHGYEEKVIATLKVNTHEMLKRVYNPNFKCATLTKVQGGYQEKKVFDGGRVRKLTPLEYERLQTLPEGYTEGFKNSTRYSVIGDGWTVDIIKFIFDNLEVNKENVIAAV